MFEKRIGWVSFEVFLVAPTQYFDLIAELVLSHISVPDQQGRITSISQT